jgi:hypothetical protein
MMSTPPDSVIAQLVALQGGPAEVARKMGDIVHYQEVQRWVKRGWGAPKYFLRLEKMLPKGKKLRDLHGDIEKNNAVLAEKS